MFLELDDYFGIGYRLTQFNDGGQKNIIQIGGGIDLIGYLADQLLFCGFFLSVLQQTRILECQGNAISGCLSDGLFILAPIFGYWFSA